MKKTLVLLFMLILITSSLLFADVDFLSLGMTGGYSKVSDTPSFGFNTAYQYMYAIGSDVYFGINTHIDLNMQFYEQKINFGTGLLWGPSFGFGFNPSNFLVATVAPAMYLETGTAAKKYEYLGLGIAVDLNHTVYLGTTKTVGITFGATGYFLFADLSEKQTMQKNNLDAVGYIGITYRAGDYTGTSETYYNIY